MNAMFCVRCGREGALEGALCASCFLATHTPARVPEVVRVEVCAHCGARRRRGTWGAPAPSLRAAIEDEVRESVDVDRGVHGWRLVLEGGEHDRTNHEYEALVTGRAGEVPFEVRQRLVVHVQRSTCTRCGRRAGGYYEGIVQLRAQGRSLEAEEVEACGATIDRVLADLHRAGDLDSFLVKGEEVKGGWDFYLGTVHAGRAIARALSHDAGAVVRETASLVGRGRDGSDLYRVTFSVKLPRVRLGGFVARGDRLHLVAGLSPKQATLVDLEDHRRHAAPLAELEDLPTLAPSEAREAVVVSELPEELQVLDPDTLRTVDLRKPAGFSPRLGTVRVVRWAERLWLLPGDRLT